MSGGAEKKMSEKCDWCWKEEPEVNDVKAIEISHPFGEPETKYICESCWNDDYDAEYCEECNRVIWNSNGMRKNLRIVNGGIICVSCLQKKWFKEGMEEFQDGDWFSDDEIKAAGYIKQESYFCRYDDGKNDFEELQSKGNAVIVSITLSGMGLEHYYDIWAKQL